jgi:MYXO-CTERM domain-containing protein
MNTKCNIALAGVATCALGTFASADVIMDQIGSMDGGNTVGGTVSASQDFDAYGAYDVVSIDDFTIGSAMNLTSASMVLGGWNGFTGHEGIEGYTVSIFSSVEAAGNSIYGDIASIYLINGVDPGISYSPMWGGEYSWLVSFDMSGVSLSAGTYWIGVTPSNAYGDNGQTGVYQSDIGDSSGWQGNPSGAFGFITQATGANYAYSLEGSGVPAPGALALLGLAGLASRRRRK